MELEPDIRFILPVVDFLASLIQPFIPTHHFYSVEPSHCPDSLYSLDFMDMEVEK